MDTFTKMTTDYDGLNAAYDNNEEYNSDADCIDDTESKAGIFVIRGDLIMQSILLENVKREDLDEQLDEVIGSSENSEKNCDIDIKFEDCSVQTGDFLVTKTETPLTGDDSEALGISSENIKVKDLNDQCDKSFTYKHKLNARNVTCNPDAILDCAQSTKSGEKRFSCDVCQKSFTRKNGLARHITIHTGKNPFSCEICKKSFSVKAMLTYHIRTHSGEKPFTCNICKKSFRLKISLKIHNRKHTGETPFPCETCKKSFCRKNVLEAHMLRHRLVKGPLKKMGRPRLCDRIVNIDVKNTFLINN